MSSFASSLATASRCRRPLRAIVVGVLLVAGSAGAASTQQTGDVAGRVTYSGNGQGVAGALVVFPELGLGVITDGDGSYRMQGVPTGRQTLVTAVMGCSIASRPVDVQPGRRLTLNLALDPPVIDLEGLLVTASAAGAGSEAPFAVARLDSGGRVLGSAATGSVGSMIQGRAAGVRVVQGSGQPGSDPSILLRGPVSIQHGQDPLIVVDGVITRSSVSDIDPSDVLRVEVLRGAAAAAGYGSRGQAGVIEITTKRGPGGAAVRRREPLVLVDGVVTAGTLADVDSAEIVDIRMIEGHVAAVLYGTAAEAGVIEVTTRSGPPAGAPTLEPACIDPTR